ncbi:MAG TPA: tetratricopeptide repeat protein [Bryobacteraceae bacterium]|nr:tetratricopeptide repeat protein [Bryobacteraceae bacterium]
MTKRPTHTLRRNTGVLTHCPRCSGGGAAGGRLLLAFTLATWGGVAFQQPAPRPALEDAAADFEQGRIAEAQQKAGQILKQNPSDLGALILEGAILDSQQRYSDAERYYQRALKIAPDSPQVLNNLGNHYLASGNRSLAREFFSKVVALEPRHANANLQLARMSVEDRQGRRALLYLSRLPAEIGAEADALLLRARALSLARECPQAKEVIGKLRAQAERDARWHFPIGMTLAECKAYDEAERSFSLALAADPRNSDILYNLGLAALRAGHAARAAGVFETALQERPDDVDYLSALAQAYLRQDRAMEAAALLARAEQRSPGRADVVLLLAQASAQLRFYEDAAAAYARYLKLKPEDDDVRLEYGATLARSGQTKAALPVLEAYVRRHPRSAAGAYELAVAHLYEDRTRALPLLDRALALDPKLTDARLARGELHLEEGRAEAALADLRMVLEERPKDYRTLVRLGQAYLALNRAEEAVNVLARAVDLAPAARPALVPYHTALEKLGRKAEAEAVLSRIRDAVPETFRPAGRSGLSEYLRLPPEGQRARYLANLRKNCAEAPHDPRWKLLLGGELLADGNTAEALATFKDLAATTSDAATLARGGRILVEFQQYEAARPLLEAALAAAPSSSDARLDLATALFHLRKPEAALALLDQAPAAAPNGDHYLLRAQILDSLGRFQEAVDSLNRGIRAAPKKPELYFQSGGFLLKHRLYQEALALLEPACRLLPDARELLLAQAVTLIHLKRTDDARKLLATMQSRWPEWERPYLLNGILLEIQSNSEEARKLLETAIALGANTPEAHYYHALAITHTTPDDQQTAQDAIGRALALAPADPYVNLLAGKIALARNDHAAAIRRLLESTRLQPTLIPAHYALVAAYRAAGDDRKSAEEVQEIKRLSGEKAASDQRPFSGDDFLFTVR